MNVIAKENPCPGWGIIFVETGNHNPGFCPARGNMFHEFCKESVDYGSYTYKIQTTNRTMADTYTQLYIQFVFAVQNRISLIHPEWEQDFYKYITGIIQNKSHKMIAINGMPDHLHMFIGFQPVDHMSELIKVVKGESSKWIKERGFAKGKFKWQEGYGAFSYSRSHIDRVYHYIMNQKEHHKTKTFLEEYMELLVKFEVDFDRRYIFKPVSYE